MPIEVRPDDLASDEVRALIAEHLAGMHSHSPPGHVNALAIEALRRPEVTFWAAWRDGVLCGCGALKQLDATSGEVKSMRTRAAFLRQGVGQAVLDEIVRTARHRGYRRLLLETGTGAAFEAAHALYLRNGFDWCEAFGDYEATDFNVFMAKPLMDGTSPGTDARPPEAAAVPSESDDLAPLPTVPLGLYRHYKGGEYEVLGVVRHSETLEPLVLYRPLRTGADAWVRPHAMFIEDVTIDGVTQPRFALVQARPQAA